MHYVVYVHTWSDGLEQTVITTLTSMEDSTQQNPYSTLSHEAND